MNNARVLARQKPVKAVNKSGIIFQILSFDKVRMQINERKNTG